MLLNQKENMFLLFDMFMASQMFCLTKFMWKETLFFKKKRKNS